MALLDVTLAILATMYAISAVIPTIAVTSIEKHYLSMKYQYNNDITLWSICGWNMTEKRKRWFSTFISHWAVVKLLECQVLYHWYELLSLLLNSMLPWQSRPWMSQCQHLPLPTYSNELTSVKRLVCEASHRRKSGWGQPGLADKRDV